MILLSLFNLIPVWKYWTYKPPLQNTDTKRLEQKQQGQKIEPNMVFIDKLSIAAPIIYVEQNSEAAFQEGLQKGVVHYPGTPQVGQSGNVYIFGHSSDFIYSSGKFKTVFTLLPKIQIGDLITVSDKGGTPYIYKVIATKIVSPKDLSVLDQQNFQKKFLSLQTSYPIGTALKRFVAVAELLP